jgi:hypothetical protein
MKKLFSSLVLLLASTSSFAGTVYMDANEYASLPDCGGTVQTKIVNGATQLNLVFSNVVNCSNFDILRANGSSTSYTAKKLGGQDRSRDGSFTIPSDLIDNGNNTITVRIQSNSKKTYDTVIVKVRQVTSDSGRRGSVSMSSNDYASLDACGGTVETKVSNGQLNVVFKNVQDCSNFEIVSANGDAYDGKEYKLQGSEQNRSGSFTIPQKAIEWGLNYVRLRLQSNSKKTSDTIVVTFLAF